MSDIGGMLATALVIQTIAIGVATFLLGAGIVGLIWWLL